MIPPPPYDATLAELHFMPSLYYVTLLTETETSMLEQNENFNKGSYRNKYLVSNNRTHQYVIIPLKKGKHNSHPIREVQISYEEDWIRIMNTRLQTEYGGLPYFSHYISDIMDMVNQEYPFLFDLNLNILTYLFKLLGREEFILTDNYTAVHQGNILDLRNRINPRYVNSRDDLLQVNQMGYFEFVPGHSFIEALFSYGPEIGLLVNQYRNTISI